MIGAPAGGGGGGLKLSSTVKQIAGTKSGQDVIIDIRGIKDKLALYSLKVKSSFSGGYEYLHFGITLPTHLIGYYYSENSAYTVYYYIVALDAQGRLTVSNYSWAPSIAGGDRYDAEATLEYQELE